ncbi:MAG: helix-turn-helix domain-containing protein [Actinobacteria bacterium]|nr:helix-turn-helix domain-containing protein [Actinomycetota bacterium]
MQQRAAVHAALGDPHRLAIVDALLPSDRSVAELGEQATLAGNLLAHHLDVLEDAGLIVRVISSGDKRRRYVRLCRGAFDSLRPSAKVPIDRPVLFVCTHNSARSQLAAALWNDITRQVAGSAGTHPATNVHPGAVAAARRAGIDLTRARPRLLVPRDLRGRRVITVCDRAHEELSPKKSWLHWSIADPIIAGDRRAFDATVDELRGRIEGLAA